MSDTTKATKQAKHTPGPWRIASPALGLFDIMADGPRGVCRMYSDPDLRVGHDNDTAEANARLIAAAPAMLAALEDIAGRGPVPGYGSAGALLVRLAGIQSIARAALAAATGEG